MSSSAITIYPEINCLQRLPFSIPSNKVVHTPTKIYVDAEWDSNSIQAICIELGLDQQFYSKYLDLVATAIAADIVPITGENRTLAFFGLKKANENPNTGIKAIIDLGNLKGPLSINSLSFVIGPRINAAGRMGDAKRAVALFIEKDSKAAAEIATTLQSENNNRKEADSSITDEALILLSQDPHAHLKKTIVVHNDHWHKGVLGIVASRLLEKYYKPTIVLTKSGDFYTGSARSIAGFNIYEGLDRCSHLLHAFGGHYFAAGMTVAPSHIHLFKEAFEAVANDILSSNDMIPEIEIDAAIELKDYQQFFLRHPSANGTIRPRKYQTDFLCKRRIECWMQNRQRRSFAI